MPDDEIERDVGLDVSFLRLSGGKPSEAIPNKREQSVSSLSSLLLSGAKRVSWRLGLMRSKSPSDAGARRNAGRAGCTNPFVNQNPR
jgi:hypothetical protein